MSHAIEIWHADHVRFRGLLDELRREIDVFHDGGRPDYERMHGIIVELRETGDRVHHPREDVAFARLARRCPDLARPLARLAQEHRIIRDGGETLDRLLSSALDGTLIPRAEIEVAAAMYIVYYGNHIAHEEEVILHRAAESLTNEDWAAVQRAA